MEIFGLDNEHGQHLIQVFNMAAQVRGPFLEQAIFIERIIDDIVSNHFCLDENRRNLFFSLVMPEIIFSKKIEILKQLLNSCYPDLGKKHPKLIKDLDNIRDFRNEIAHAMLDTSDEFMSKKCLDRIQFKSFKKGQTKPDEVTSENIKEKLKDCTRIILMLGEIQSEVKKRNSISEKL
jgi:hypothetical protein